MIAAFESGKWYIYRGKKLEDYFNSDPGKMDFCLDGKPHKCKVGDKSTASFFDSSDPNYLWSWSLNLWDECGHSSNVLKMKEILGVKK